MGNDDVSNRWSATTQSKTTSVKCRKPANAAISNGVCCPRLALNEIWADDEEGAATTIVKHTQPSQEHIGTHDAVAPCSVRMRNIMHARPQPQFGSETDNVSAL